MFHHQKPSVYVGCPEILVTVPRAPNDCATPVVPQEIEAQDLTLRDPELTCTRSFNENLVETIGAGVGVGVGVGVGNTVPVYSWAAMSNALPCGRKTPS